jgi:hypothetical protein
MKRWDVLALHPVHFIIQHSHFILTIVRSVRSQRSPILAATPGVRGFILHNSTFIIHSYRKATIGSTLAARRAGM